MEISKEAEKDIEMINIDLKRLCTTEDLSELCDMAFSIKDKVAKLIRENQSRLVNPKKTKSCAGCKFFIPPKSVIDAPVGICGRISSEFYGQRVHMSGTVCEGYCDKEDNKDE